MRPAVMVRAPMRLGVAATAVVSVMSAGACHRSQSGGSAPGVSATGAPATAGDAARRAGAARGTPGAAVRVMLVNDVYMVDTMRDGRGGLARVAAIRDSIERRTGAPVLLVLAGDFLSPSLLGKWYNGAQMVDAFNAARLNFATIGNHEFDGTRATLMARIEQSRFRWLSGNCHERTGMPFPGVRGWDTVTVSGQLVGFFGTTVERDYPAWVNCGSADSATHAMVDTLKRMGALVIGLTHRFVFDDTMTLRAEPAVTAILGGHEHDGRRHVVNGKLVIKAQSNLRTVALVTFQPVRARDGVIWTTHDTIIRIGAGMREDPATRAVVARWRDSLSQRIGTDRVLGMAPVAIDATDSTSHLGESAFGDLVADAIREGTHADVALINSGAMRLDDVIGPGAVTSHLLEAVFLFADETRVVTFALSGARLRELLEHGVARGSLGAGAYPQVSGVRFTFDPSRTSEQRIVGGLTREDGRAIASTDTLRVSFVSYPACRNGDGYRIPEAGVACRVLERDPASLPRTAELLVKHVEAMHGRVVPPSLGRVTRVGKR